MTAERTHLVRFSIIVEATIALIVLCAPALAFGLTDADYDYLATQNVPRDSAVLRALSPKEQARLHAIIIDRASEHDPTARAKNVADALALYQEHQRWELEHPGQLWDQPRR
jgi:hypothetical protein